MMKGIAILSVVIYHLLAPCGVKTVMDQLAESSLGIFFFFSGYFYRPGKHSTGENMKRRVQSLMIPFFKYSLFFWLAGTLVQVLNNEYPFIEALGCLRNFYGGCGGSDDQRSMYQPVPRFFCRQ